jgi:hypothetical protein
MIAGIRSVSNRTDRHYYAVGAGGADNSNLGDS